jgi:galactose mutarotase-like enzyme
MWHSGANALNFNGDFSYKGFRLCMLENEHWRVSIMPERGAEIVSAHYKLRGFEVLGHLPERMADRDSFPPAPTPAGAAFVNGFAGGWQSVFPNGGSACSHDGVAHEMMGEGWRLNWRVAQVANDGGSLSATFETATTQTPFRLVRTITLRAADPVFDVVETVTNTSRQPMDFMWGQHLTFDAGRYGDGDWGLDLAATRAETNTGSVLDPDARQPGLRRNLFPAGGDFAWPSMETVGGASVDGSELPRAGSSGNCDMIYLRGCDGWFALMNRRKACGVFMRWPAERLPYLWYWQNFGGSFGYPWFGKGNIFALEPFTSYPAYGLAEAAERGVQCALAPGQSVSFPMNFGWIEGRSRISGAADLPDFRAHVSHMEN